MLKNKKHSGLNRQLGAGLVILFLMLFALPSAASAGWLKDLFSPAAPVSELLAESDELSPTAQRIAEEKYGQWQESFDKCDMEAVIANQNNFSFSVAELNYLFASESAKAEKPFANNFRLSLTENDLNISMNFLKKMKGHAIFTARIVSEENKIRMKLSHARWRRIPVPASWLNGLLNQELDDYFSFLYEDSHYKTMIFNIDGENLELIPIFKE